jgi:hypothetical protein
MKKILEGVYRIAARFVTSDYRDCSPGSMTHMIHQLQWDTLVDRRETSRLIMLYKILHGLVDIHAPTYLTLGDNRKRGARKYLNSLQARKSTTRILVRIDPPHPLVCRKRRLNGAVLRMTPEKPRSRVAAGVTR